MRVCPVCARPGAAGESRCRVDGASLVQLEAAEGATATDLSGQVVDGRYFVERVVGRGGMGTVYAARHVVVGRHVALKVLKPAFEHREETLARFVREAQAANAVKSRYIVRADDFGQLPNGSLYVVMDLLEGRSLGAALRQRLLTREQLLRVFVQVAEGLGAAHQAGVVHRDLKPDNVFLVDDDVEKPSVRILDFGVAKLQSDSSGLTSTGVILGTPNYMSPEQARGQAVDHRADIYALGVVMYQAFTGRLPFVADSAVGVLTAHAVDEPARPALSGVDAGLEAVILRCMRKRPVDRFASMEEVAAAVRASWGFGGDALPPAPPSRSSQLAPGAAAWPGSGAFGASSASAARGVGATGQETGSGLSAPTQAPVSRGVYVALGAGLALVGVVAALLVARPGGLLGALLGVRFGLARDLSGTPYAGDHRGRAGVFCGALRRRDRRGRRGGLIGARSVDVGLVRRADERCFGERIAAHLGRTDGFARGPEGCSSALRVATGHGSEAPGAPSSGRPGRHP